MTERNFVLKFNSTKCFKIQSSFINYILFSNFGKQKNSIQIEK